MIQTILVNGKIITLDERRPRVDALAISYGRVVALGDDAALRRLAGADTTLVDLDGKTVLPGLVRCPPPLGSAGARLALGQRL